MPWKIEFDGHTHRENDITIGQAERIEDMTGESWLRLSPLRSAKHARAILTVFHCDATGESEAQTAAKIRQIKLGEFLEMFGQEDEDIPELFENGNPPVADAP